MCLLSTLTDVQCGFLRLPHTQTTLQYTPDSNVAHLFSMYSQSYHFSKLCSRRKKKLLNGKFTFKSCVVQKKRASLLSENVNRQLAESKEVVGLPFIGNLTVTVQCF